MKRSHLLLLAAILVPGTCASAQRQATPGTIALGRAGGAYGPVRFPHRDHARMAGMGGGCISCHHFDTAGATQSCSACHSPERARANLEKPDRRGAMHRQCFECHRDWRSAAACGACHTERASRQGRGDVKAAATPPAVRESPVPPTTLVYETRAKEGRFVTFGHRLHATTFGLTCAGCHRRAECATCHATPNATSRVVRTAGAAAPARTTDDAHAHCASCHARSACATCHAGRPAQDTTFNHAARTGWALNRFHRALTCQRCHPASAKPAKVNADCESCHKDWQGSFDHAKAGIVLDDLHTGADCTSCHSDKTFASPPACGDCHTDKAWPTDKPGKVVPGVVRKKE